LPDDVSSVATGGGGMIGVSVLVAVCPTTSVTRYVIGVLVPAVIELSAVNVTMPVAGSRTYVPSPVMVTELSSSHVVVAGVNKQVSLAPVVTRPVPDARPELPVIVVNVAVPPGNRDLVSGVATGAVGGSTVNVIVEFTNRSSVSAAWYFTVVAVPVKVSNGSKVTTPVVWLTVYVPSPVTVSDVALQFGGVDSSTVRDAVSSAPHNFTVERTNGIDEAPGVSFAVGVTV
jgi:hypothetical protein